MFSEFVSTSISLPPPRFAPLNNHPGYFKLGGSSGVPGMHVAITSNQNVVFLDKVENCTVAKLQNGKNAYSSEYHLEYDTFTPLSYRTNAFCSGGTTTKNGSILSVGGNAPLPDVDPDIGDGFRGIRLYHRAKEVIWRTTNQTWVEPGWQLSTSRWYPSAERLSDARILVCGGSKNGLDPQNPDNNNPTCEILLETGQPTQLTPTKVTFLEKNFQYVMYIALIVLPSCNVFMMAGSSSQVINPRTMQTVRSLPTIPGMLRTYPLTAAIAPLPLSYANAWKSEILVCGGTLTQEIISLTDHTCGRIEPEGTNPTWEMDAMPEGRVMGDSVLLHDGRILIVNGAKEGAAGFGMASQPVTRALLYDPDRPLGKRFTQAATSDIARMYHSAAIQLKDGRIMIAGSNPNEQPVFSANKDHPFPTELRTEFYYPSYITPDVPGLRPTNVKIDSILWCACLEVHTVEFDAPANASSVQVTLMATGFVTHSVHMGQRLLRLHTTGFATGTTGPSRQTIMVESPPNTGIAPAGYYWLCVLVDGYLADSCLDVQIFALLNPRNGASYNYGDTY
ncbi:galactose oxidase [Tothia fuscella]|uniref:Galactose oxidase n=1 Tax=Tothia fuscella TaxID=1048955 RepID=A0A9P4U530_9PEZI|nr:galactose oxidase [Tothia fuscella]